MAIADALRLLSRRDLSRAALTQRLHKRGHSAEAIETACCYCEERGYVDDERYGLARATRRLEAQPRGRRAVVIDLRRQGLTETMSNRVARKAVETLGGEGSLVTSAVEKWCARHGCPEDWKAAKRCYDYLVRRGFSAAMARDALRQWLDELGMT